MSWRKLILVIIFYSGSADSNKPGSFKLQMKDGNFYFNDGNGEVPLETMEKGPDLSAVQDINGHLNPPTSNLENTLKILDKTLFDVENGSGRAVSNLDILNQREKLNELRRILEESSLVDALGDEKDAKTVKGAAADWQNSEIKKDLQPSNISKISDADMQKIREVLDKEYGKSILLIPKNDLEYFIQSVREYSLNDLLKNGDSNEFQSVEDRLRVIPGLAPVPRTPFNWNSRFISKPRSKEEPLTPEENRKFLIQEFSKLLDRVIAPAGHSGFKDNFHKDLYDQFRVPKSLGPRVDAPDEAVMDFIDNLSDDKSHLKQSLLQWFKPDTKHLKRIDRRSVQIKSAPVKKKKDKQRGQHNVTTQFQRISRRGVTLQEKPFQGIHRLDSNGNKDANQIVPHHRPLGNEERFVSNERQTRADFIR